MSENNNINENENVTLDDLLEELNGDTAGQEPKPNNDIVNDIEGELDKAVASDLGIKTVTENGLTLVDVTEQYVKPKEQKEQEATNQTIQKKKVRTFNEIFADFFKSVLPQKKDKTREKIRKVIMDLSVITIIGCVIAFGVLYRDHRIEILNGHNIHGSLIDTDNLNSDQYDDAWEELFSKYPSVKFPEGMNLKYAYLYAINPELVGWLKIDGTNLDVQVVQTMDNEKYLKTDFYGKKSRYGCPYVDYRNDAKYLNDNTIIYGHHMSDGLMFSNLDKYKTIEGYKESPIIQYDTLYKTYYFKIVAAFVTNSLAEDDNGYIFNYMVTDFSSDEKFMNYVDELRKRSIFKTDVSVLPDDKLLTLSTCSYEFSKARLVVVARLCRENEEPIVDTTNATINSSPRYPQSWYDAKKISNPYKDDVNWTP